MVIRNLFKNLKKLIKKIKKKLKKIIINLKKLIKKDKKKIEKNYNLWIFLVLKFSYMQYDFNEII